jgi:hypothetical protein
MTKIAGIKSVDFTLEASGEGVINHNGALKVFNPAAGQMVDNHLFPKMRGIDPMQRELPTEGAEGKLTKKVLSLADPALASAALIVSAGCLRSHLFKAASFGVSEVTRTSVGDALASLHGLMRGYLITNDGANFARKSSLYLSDLECAKPGLRFNQGSKAGPRTSTSIFSFFATDKDLSYTGYGSLSVEDLQFIPLENSLGRSSYSEVVSEAQGEELAAYITQYLQESSGSDEPAARFVNNAVRKGSYARNPETGARVGEAGILLNDAAISFLVDETLELLKTLFIRQGKGFLRVDTVSVDYNEGQALRMLRDALAAQPRKTAAYAEYYDVEPLPSATFNQKMVMLEAGMDADKKKKKAKATKPKKAQPEVSSEAPAAVDTE